jgi:hypothetical protein
MKTVIYPFSEVIMRNFVRYRLAKGASSAWTVVEEPINGDPLDVECIDCHSHQNELKAEVIQYGLKWDKHTYFIICEQCRKQMALSIDMAFEEI